MKLKPEQAAFRMPLEDLLVLAGEKIAYTRRVDDTAALNGRGWTAERISTLEEQFHALGKMPTDTELEQDVRAAEQKKNLLRESITTLIQTALGKVNQVHHDESAEYRAFGSAKLYKSGDPAFALLCEQLSRVGQRMPVDGDAEELAAYASAGLTPAEFIAIGSQGDEFRRLLIDIRTAEARRDIGTQNRLRLANPAYRDLAALSEVGKSVFISKDEARYNDYVIYDPAPEGENPAVAGASAGAADSAATGHMTDNTNLDTGSGRTGGIASRDAGGGDPYTGAPTGR
ncbi:MAG: hypothetical protein H7330_04105 [Hymenobacteraceae bacterium]|nr:hypothetical protein [Hymenobacteraceae bacterium]